MNTHLHSKIQILFDKNFSFSKMILVNNFLQVRTDGYFIRQPSPFICLHTGNSGRQVFFYY